MKLKITVISFSVLFIVTFLIFSCKKDNKDETTKILKSSSDNIISYGTSFGECVGYCKTEMIIQDSLITLTRSSWDSTKKAIVVTKPFSAKDWNDFIDLVNKTGFDTLKDVYGCPDCTDGGAEWIEVNSSELKHKVVVEYMSNNPAVLTEVLQKLRQILATMNE